MNSELKQINTDIIFFFLLVICSIVSFSLILEKKRTILKTNKYSEKNQNDMYHFNRLIILIIAIYFVINSYTALENMKKNNDPNMKNQENVFLASCLTLVAAYIYFNSNTASNTLIYY